MKQTKRSEHGRPRPARAWAVVQLSMVMLFWSSLGVEAGGREEATFRATVSGDISGGPQSRAQVIRDNTTQIVISKPSMVLDLSYFRGVSFKAPDDGADCFAAGSYGGAGNGGSMHISQERDGSGLATAWIRGATANDGVSDLTYRLDMTGSYDDPNNWPPALGTSNTLRIDGWEMSSEGKGQLKKISCTGSGSFDNPTSILVERTD